MVQSVLQLLEPFRLSEDWQQRHRIPRATIFPDSKTAVKRMLNANVGPAQTYALEEGKEWDVQ